MTAVDLLPPTRGLPPVLQGRQFPVEVMYTVAPEESYVDSAITTALQIHLDEAPGDILVFLTGQVWEPLCETPAAWIYGRHRLSPPSPAQPRMRLRRASGC